MKLTAWEHFPYPVRKAWRVMRITTLLILVISLHLSAKTTAQKITLNSNDISIEQFFKQLKKQTGYSFLLENGVISKDEKISVNVKDASLEMVLDQILKPINLSYKIENKTVYILKSPGLLSSKDANLADFPPIDIHGRVTDSLGNPLPNVSITVKGAKTGTTTDANGNFSLYGVNENATLIISNVGYAEQVVKLKGKNDLVIALKHHSTSLLEVVVNKGYYNTTQALNTGDVTTVSGADIQKQPVSDPILALEGRVPGLYIQQFSGAPGAYSTVRIQGQNSIFNGNDPLYIVDGVPYSATPLTSVDIGGGMLGTPQYTGNNFDGEGMSPFNMLNPADIGSIEVLKDADATAIYGSRGANGVILITTKKGKAGNNRIDANVYSGVGKVTRRMQLLNTQQYLEMRHEALNNDGLSPDPNNDYDLLGWDTTRYTDWQKQLIGNNAAFTNAQLNVSGGSANTQFVVGGGYSSQGTVFPGSYSDKKAMGHMNLTHSSTDNRFHLQMSVNYVNDNSDLPNNDLTSQITLAPDAPPVYNTNGTLNWQPENGNTSTWQNPLAYTVIHANSLSYNLISNLILNYEILRGLNFKANFGYNQAQMDQVIITPATADPPPVFDYYRTNLLATNQAKSWITEPQLSYDLTVSKGKISLLVGTTFEQNVRSSVSYYANGFGSDALISNPAAASSTSVFGSEYSDYRYTALFLRGSYTWDDKYIVNLTGRRDGSSRFGPGKQFGNFGALGLGWIFSKEAFINNNLSFLSFGKLRASYGITGNDQIGNYQYLSAYNASSYNYQGLTGLNPTGLTNPNLAWEQVKKMEGGLDLGFFHDRILLAGSYYINKSDNQLVEYVLPRLTGFPNVEKNFPAIVQNTGIELTLNTINLKSKNFNWTSSINMTIPENKLLAFPNLATSSYNSTYAVGQSLFIQYVFHNTGVDPQTGIYSFTTKNGNGVPSAPSDYIISKPVTQSLYGGFENKLTYKGFQLDLMFQFVKQLAYNYINRFDLPGVFNANEPNYVLSRWQVPGNLTNIEKFTSTYSTGVWTGYSNLETSDAAISDASFIRLKNLALSYELPAVLEKKMRLQSARVYVQCQNLLTITGYKGLDPETQGLSLPPLRMVTGGVQISL